MTILNCTNTNQLADFVAHIVPKIWNGVPLYTIQHSNNFRLFCQNLIKATQISTPCILVSLFYISKLRFQYPSIKGSMGSEVRLFTTALILANKFLDDNTFTNKTWSEVSSVPLHELNIMEMEFLSALQYKTRVHHSQFYSWTAQCQLWMTQLMTRPVLIPTIPKRLKRAHPYHNPRRHQVQQPMLSWSSSTVYPSAASVATVAAATAMNVNFIPRAFPQQ